jgi:hypothetical protein
MDYKNISNFQTHQTHQQPQQPQSVSVSEVRTNLIELRNITAEMNRLKNSIKTLSNRSKTLTDSIQNYLRINNQQSISYGDFKIEYTTKQRRQRKKKAEKEKDVLAVLQKAGIRDAKRLYLEIDNSLKGELTTQSSVKVDTVQPKTK